MEEMVSTLLTVKGAVIAVWLLLFFVAERLRPAAVDPTLADGRWNRAVRNLALFLLNGGVSFAVVVPVTAWAATHALDWRPSAWPAGVGGLLIDLLLLDFFIYWWHRLNHVLPVLWRFHQVHHMDRFLDSTSAVRFHFGEVILSALVRGAFVFAMGIPLSSVLMFEVLVLLSSIFQHSNIRLPVALDRALSTVIVTPGWHWMHHHALRADTDSNYANTLTVWDRLFASRSPNDRDLLMEIGIERVKSDAGFLELLGKPFIRKS